MQSSSSSSSKHYVRVQRGDPQMSRQLVQELESGDVAPVFRSRTQISSKDTEDVYRSGENRGGVRTIHTTRVVKHVTTSSRGENKTVTETMLTSSDGGNIVDEPTSTSVIEYHRSSPDVRSLTKTTTKVVKHSSGGTAPKTEKGTITTTSVKKSPANSCKVVTEKSRRVTSKSSKEVSALDASKKSKSKISDIITHTGVADECVTAREALLRWAQRTTERYPGVRISDFTNSWKDGLAFSAIIHRNRPDLLDFHSLRVRSAHDNLENAFGIAEKEFGITRLLDPEDVDTPEPDEKSIITYISSMYDVFSEPPVCHPLVDDERQKKIKDYKESTIALQMWLLESASMLKRRIFPNTVAEMKGLQADCSQFRSVEMPKYLKEKQRLSHLHKEIQKLPRESGQVTFEGDLKIESVEKNWELLIAAIQDRERSVKEEILRLERLQKQADKINREMKLCDSKLDDIEKRIQEEMKRAQRLQSVDAKSISEHVESSMKSIDVSFEQMRNDSNSLLQNGFAKAMEIANRISVLHERYQSIRNSFYSDVLPVLSEKSLKIEEKKIVKRIGGIDQKNSETARLFQAVKEHTEWVEKKMKKLQATEIGSDISSIKVNLEHHRNEHKSIESYSKKIEKCSSNKSTFAEDESDLYAEAISNLDKSYVSLKNLSSGIMHELESLLDFVNSVSKELKWISDKIDIEVGRDWSSKALNLSQLESYQECLTADLEKHEFQLTSIQNVAENLLNQNHPAASAIESYISQLQVHWSWLLQLALSLETHLKHAQSYHQFFKEGKECENYLKGAEEKLNTTFSRTIISVDEGEKTLKQLHRLKEELTNYSNKIQTITNKCSSIVQLKQRKQGISKPLKIIAVCNFKEENVSIHKDDCCMLQECIQKNKWKIKTSQGEEVVVPSVCFVISSSNPEAIDFAEQLKKKYSSVIALWTTKEKKLHQNLIIATMKVVKSWDEVQFQAMETNQRESIIRALNEDAQKLLTEGAHDDQSLKKLKQELDNCNHVFQSLKEKMSVNETKEVIKLSSKTTLVDEINLLQAKLNEKESVVKMKIDEQMHWDVDTLENLVLNHKEFEIALRSSEDKMKQIKQSYSSLTKKTQSLQTQYQHLISTWDKLWNLSNLYVERLKAVETAVNAYAEATQIVSGLEVQLASFGNMPSHMNELHKVHDTLLSLQAQVLQQQQAVELVSQSFQNVKKLMQRSRSKQSVSSDITKFENDIKKLNERWKNLSSQILERLQSCGATSELLHTYQTKIAEDQQWITKTTVKIDTLKSVKTLATNEVDKQVESVMDLHSSIADHSSSFEQTNILGARYIREAKSCIEENYKTCKENISKLLSWVAEIELNLASLGLVKEDLTSLQHQINTTKALKDQLMSQQHLINTCIDQVHQLEKQGLEVLNQIEVDGLQKDLQSVKRRYDLLMNESDRLLRRLVAAFEELQKFKTEIHAFKQWLKKTQKTFIEKENSLKHLKSLNDNFEYYREFANDVIAHQADIRFITIAAQKFTDESKDYLKILNLFRTNLPHLPHMEPVDNQVKAEVQAVSASFFDLLNNVNKLSDSFSVLCSKYQYYFETYQKASSWFDETKKLARKSLGEFISAEPSAVQEQLDYIKTLNMEIVGQGRLVENVEQAWKSLSESLNNYHVKPSEEDSIKSTVNTMSIEYRSIVEKISYKIKELQTALIHSQDIQDGLDRLLKWLNETDLSLQNQSRLVSLHPEKLSEQVQEFKILHSDVNNQKQSIEMINTSAQSLANSNPKSAQKIESKLKEFNANFQKLCEKILKREQLLEEISSSVRTFETLASQFEEFTTSLLDRLESHDVIQELDLDGFASIVEGMMNQRNSKQNDFEKMIKLSKSLISRSEITDSTYLKERVKILEQSWKHLGSVISDKQVLGKARSEQLAAWESLRCKVVEWLSKQEIIAENMILVSLVSAELKKQANDVKLLVKEHAEYKSTIERLNKLGDGLDVTVKRDTSQPKTGSPSKKQSSPTRKSPSKAKSPDSYPASPTKSQTISQSPLSTASSGFSSRRSSTDNFCVIGDMSPIQQQITEINHRYSILGVKFNDRLQEVDQLSSELREIWETLKMLQIFLDAKQKQFPKASVPSSREQAEKCLKLLKTIESEMMEKQSEMENFKSHMQKVVNRKGIVKSSSELQHEATAIGEQWSQLQSSVKENITIFQDCKDFDDAYFQLQSYLQQREKMFQVLGPIASDPRIISSQVQQVKVMIDELSSQKSLLDRLKQSGKSILKHFEASSGNTKRVEEQLSSICNLWDDLFSRLEDRDRNLEMANGVAKEFFSSQSQIQDKLQKINDSFDSFLESNVNIEEQLKKIIVLEEQLEKQRPLLTDADSVCEKLCEILRDSASRNDIQNKISGLEKLYSMLYKKINNRKAELEACLKEDKFFYQSCDGMNKWLDKSEKMISTNIIYSGEMNALMKQVKQFEPCYKSVMDKEHELHLVLSKGEDMLGKLNNKQEHNLLKSRLENMKKQYEVLKKTVLNRHTSLQCFLDNYKKYDAAFDAFVPWLETSIVKLSEISISSLQRPVLNKEVKEVQVLKNDITKHIQEYENIQHLGETLLISCTDEKEKIKKQLNNLQKKWEQLNHELSDKMQTFDDLSQRFVEYQEKLRDLQHTVQRLEDKLSSHDALGSVSRDPILLCQLKELQKTSVGMTKQLESLKHFSKTIISKAGNKADVSQITEEVDALETKLGVLINALQDRSSKLATSSKIVSNFTAQVKSVCAELEVLDDIFEKLSPVGRHKNAIQQQLTEIKEFTSKVLKIRSTYESVEQQCKDIISQGHLPDSDAFKDQLSGVQKKILKLEEHLKAREISLQTILSRIIQFSETYQSTRNQLDEIIKQEQAFSTTGGDVGSIKAQQEAFKMFRNEQVHSLNKVIDDCHKLGQSLIQSASAGVCTNDLERDLDSLNELWNSLQERITEREKKLDVALLQSGKFQEALEGVKKWLADTEELVCNQKAPSSDYKVVKAQVQEQKFLKKMLLDRQNSVVSLKMTGNELLRSTAKKKEQEQVDGQMVTIIKRFEELNASAEERMKLLEKTIPIAQDFQNSLSPLLDWIEQTEKKLTSATTVPVEHDLVKKKIIEQKAVHEDIVSHKQVLEKLKIISEKLKKLVGKDEVNLLEQKVKSITTKYTTLTEMSSQISKDLHSAEKGLVTFTEKYEKSLSWIEKTSIHVGHFQTLYVYTDKLELQIKELKKLKESFSKEQPNITSIISSGQNLMKHASGEDTIHVKEKLDTLNIKFSELSNVINERLKLSDELLPLVKSFYSSNAKLSSWLDSTERTMKSLDSSSLDIQQATIKNLQVEIQDHRSLLETVNHTGPRISQSCPGDGASSIENIISKANHRFDSISESVQRKAERVELAVQKKFDVVGDMDEVMDWFRDIEKQVQRAEGLSPEPNSLLSLLNQQKVINSEVSSQKSRVREILAAAKKLMRESSTEDVSFIHDKAETLKNLSSSISTVCQDRLSIIEQALPLAKHFFETHLDLRQWLDVAESEAELLEAPALNSTQIKKQQDRNKGLAQSVNEHKPLVDKLNKTGSALCKLCKEEETEKVDVILESDNSRYNALRKILREHQCALEEALQATSQFSDKLEGMLNALTSTADQIQNAEPISAHPERIQEQINDNKAVLQDLEKRTSALEAVKKAADEVIIKAGSIDEPAVKDITKKLDHLNFLWETIQTAARNRGKSLEEALIAAERFWDELTAVMKALKDLQDNLNNQEYPAVEPNAVQQQQEVLQEIKQEISQTKPEVDHCRQAGQDLMQLCGEPDKPEVKKHIEDLDSVWENVTTLYAKREQNLIDALEKAMSFHDTLQNLLEFLDTAEEKFEDLGAVSSDTDSVKKQVNQLKEFKSEVDPHMIEVESLNRQAQELVERTSPDQSLAIREPLDDINKRWNNLLKSIVNRQQQMENVLLKLGQFQHTLDELTIWITKTENSLDELKPIFGDTQVIEVVLAKHKVLMNDIQAHESSMDAINQAGRQFTEADGTEDLKSTQNKLNALNSRWQQLQENAIERQRELQEALKEAMQFHQEIQDLLMWLNDIDGQLVTSKPVGGLPETAKEQLNKFMDLYSELDSNRHKVENIMQQGQMYSKKSGESSTKRLQHNLHVLHQRWDSIQNKANDRKIKLEIALREATEFHEALQTFVEWLTNSEKYLTSLKPVSRSMKLVLEQIEDHRNFQKDVGSHREVMINLDKKGTHLKYFSQKQDVILIKNLLISVQHRWERVVSKAAERTRLLDHGYKEAKEFHDAWTSLSSWLDEAEKTLDSITHIGNDPSKIKQLLSKHKEFQRVLGSKQISYDSTMRNGRALKEKCPKHDVHFLQSMIDELKTRWNRVCSKSVDRQRKLEEALLFSGQFKEAVQALLDWLDKAISKLSEIKNYHGDLDTVAALIEKHKVFQEELSNRNASLSTIQKSVKGLKESASAEDTQHISSELEKLESKWTILMDLSDGYKSNLDVALELAEELHKSVHGLLEWLSEAEIKLRFVGPLPEDEDATNAQIASHQEFLKEMDKRENDKNDILLLAHEILKKCHPDGLSAIRQWITIIQSRWEEISTWAKQRDQRLLNHLKSLRDLMELLEKLLTWLIDAEAQLTSLEAEALPDDLSILEQLIKEHQIFMDEITKKQSDVERITKAFSFKREANSVLQHLPRDKHVKDKLHGTPTFPVKAIKQPGDPDVKHPRAKLLLEKWREVWLLAMERQRRLQDKYNYLKDLERIKNFDFDEWRRKYLSWMSNKKSRIMDQFRKIDKNNDGKVTKQEFIDGILSSKFVTSRLEMERVADVFDMNGDGFIDTKEYIDTLRPEREGSPKTEAEKIQDEVQRQVAKCTCVHRFKVYQVGEGKYRFGDSQKLRLVRILRSTVMVRVGGGWVALDEFLVKNDPCRAKGRTNLELREQFILAEGVSQSMAPFKPKPSPNSSVSSQSGTSPRSIPSSGPITKIREKSERSTPMHQSRSSADSSSDVSAPGLTDTKSCSNKSVFSRLTPTSNRMGAKASLSKSNSHSSSQQGSRPSSRAASDLSQDAVEKYKVSGSPIDNHGVNSSLVSAAKSSTVGSKIPSAKRSGAHGKEECQKRGSKSK